MRLILLVGLLPGCLYLRAQDSAAMQRIDSLSEVVVTGSPRGVAMRRNPVAVVSVTGKMLDQAVSPNVIDALVLNVPGLNVVKTGPNISKPFIRGLGYNRVLTLYDGLRQEGQQWGDEHGIEVDGYNLSKAEVIKGPASLMYGSDALAGVVSLFPWMPRGDDGRLQVRVQQEYQSNNGLWGAGLRLGASGEHWLWALRGSRRVAANYQNAIDGRVYNTGFKESNLSATGGYVSAKGSTMLHFTWYDDLQGIPDGSRDSLTRKFTRQVAEGSQDDIKNRPVVTGSELLGYRLSPLHQHITHYRLYANSHYRLGTGEIDGQLGWQQNLRREFNHPTDPAQAGMNVRLNTLNYGLRYLAPEIGGVGLSAGVNGMVQDNKHLDATDFPIPGYGLLDVGSWLYGKWQRGKWTASGGLRYDIRRLHTRTGDGFTGFEKNFQGLSLSLGATCQLTPAIFWKFNIARGYRSPNITELASNGLDPGAHIIYLGNPGFSPEFSLQEDIGLGGVFKDWEFNASVFHNALSDYIYLNQVVDASGEPLTDAQGNRTFQYRQASARLYGVEAGIVLHPLAVPGLRIEQALAVVYGSNTNAAYRHAGVMGEWLPLIPPMRLTTGIGQTFGFTRGKLSEIHVRAGYVYNAEQRRYLALYGTETATVSYGVIDAGADLTFLSGSREKRPRRLMRIVFQINNLTDLAYQDHTSRLKYFEHFLVPAGHPSGIYNMGRNVCFKVLFDL